ncbi:HTH-type transcriptional activator RhaS [bioreactor metagenome]|uniref:HTH-type transcriptional activator RhaS n=1 Tax=bioreactor metagenome TaxID=1076179 RepID=A0A645E8T4_9ZZZZ
MRHVVQRPEYFLPADAVNRRQFWKVFYVVAGGGEFRVNGRGFPVDPGFVCLSHPDDLTNMVTDLPVEMYQVLFQKKAIEDDLARLYNDNDFFSVFRPEFRPERSLNHDLLHLIDSNRKIRQVILRMLHEYNHADGNTGEMLRFMLLELLVEFSRRSASRFRRRRRSEAVADIDGYLGKHYAEPLRVEELARKIALSQGYLFGFYRRATGRTIGETLLSLRIEAAKKLLLDTEMEVRQVCFRCGFSDLSNFYKVFRRETGVAPGGYRKEGR